MDQIRKNLITSYNELLESYTKEGAESYTELYKDKPLSFVMENSRYIFSEPMYGLDFYKGIVESAYIDPYMLYEESIKVSKYMEENASKMGAEQKEKYKSLENILTKKVNEVRDKIVLESVYTMNDIDERRRVIALYDAVYAYENSEEKDGAIVEAAAEGLNANDLFIHAVPAAGHIFEASRTISKKVGDFKIALESSEDSFSAFEEASFICSVLTDGDIHVEVFVS